MKYDFILTSEQQVLVEQHMDLVGWVISRHIRTNEGVYGLGRDDLSQEGNLDLITTAPSVVYRLTLTSGETVNIDSFAMIFSCSTRSWRWLSS